MVDSYYIYGGYYINGSYYNSQFSRVHVQNGGCTLRQETQRSELSYMW